MSESNVLKQDFIDLVARSAGVHRRINEDVKGGSVDAPATILDIHPTAALSLDREKLSQRHILYTALGGDSSEGFDTVIPCAGWDSIDDGLDTECLQERLEGIDLRALVIAHQAGRIRDVIYAEIVASALMRMPDGGRVALIDESGWQGHGEMVRTCAQSALDDPSISVNRSVITPVASPSFALKITRMGEGGGGVLAQCEGIRAAVDAGRKGDVNLKSINYGRSMERVVSRRTAQHGAKKIELGNLAVEVFEFVKLSGEQVRRVNKKRRELNRKKRKDKKKKRK